MYEVIKKNYSDIYDSTCKETAIVFKNKIAFLNISVNIHKTKRYNDWLTIKFTKPVNNKKL